MEISREAVRKTGHNAVPARCPTSERGEVHPLLTLQQQAGNQAVQSLLRARLIQAKLAVSNPSDPEEREADQVAGCIGLMPGGAPTSSQRSCTSNRGRRQECLQENEGILARKWYAGGSLQAPETALPNALRSECNPLDAASRAYFEPRFGRDLSHVQVHVGPEAEQSARSINALAYTAGNHIVFGSGQYRPGSSDGQRLLAHELTHVSQQARKSDGPLLQRKCGKAAIGPTPAGCKLVKFSASGQITGIRIRFNQGCDDFADGEEARLAGLLDPTKITAKTNITIRGMASDEGDADYNNSLSCNRAAAAVEVLNRKGYGPNVKSVEATGGIPGTANDPDFRAVEINITDSPVPSQGPSFSILGMPVVTAVVNQANASVIDTYQVHQAMGDFDLKATVAMQAANAADFNDWQIGAVQTLAKPVHQRCFRFPPGVIPPPGHPHPNDVYVASQSGSELLVPDRDDSDPIFMSNHFFTDLDSVHHDRTSFSYPVTAHDTPALGGFNGLANYTNDLQDARSLVFREHKFFVAFTHVVTRQRSSGRIIPLYTVQWFTFWDIGYTPSAGTGIPPEEQVLDRRFDKMSEHVFSPGDIPPIVGGKAIRNYPFTVQNQVSCPLF